MHAMGSNQYLRTIRQQAHGYVRGGEDTDPPMVAPEVQMEVEEGWENESEENTDEELSDGALNPDRDLETRQGEITASIDDLRRQLNDALTVGSYDDAAELQQTILLMMDRLNSGSMRRSSQRREMYLRCAERMEKLSRRAQRRGNQDLANHYMAYAASYRNSM